MKGKKINSERAVGSHYRSPHLLVRRSLVPTVRVPNEPVLEAAAFCTRYAIEKRLTVFRKDDENPGQHMASRLASRSFALLT